MSLSRKRLYCLVVLVLIAAAATGCSSHQSRRGYIPSDAAIEQIRIGSSRQKVDIVMGTPSFRSDNASQSYYYVSEVYRRDIFGGLDLKERNIFVIHFDQNDRIEQFAHYGLHDGRIVHFGTQELDMRDGEGNILMRLFSPDSMVLTPLPGQD